MSPQIWPWCLAWCPNLIPRTHVVEREAWLLQVSSNLHMCPGVPHPHLRHAHTNTQMTRHIKVKIRSESLGCLIEYNRCVTVESSVRIWPLLKNQFHMWNGICLEFCFVVLYFPFCFLSNWVCFKYVGSWGLNLCDFCLGCVGNVTAIFKNDLGLSLFSDRRQVT